MAKELAIVLNNGSVNSAVATALAAQKYRPILLHLEQGPRAGSRWRSAYDMQVAHFKPFREHTLEMPFLSIFNSPSAASLSDARGGAATAATLIDLLPLVSLAARFAIHYKAVAIYLGLSVGPGGDELARATEFLQIWTELIQMPCNQPELEVVAPLLELEPWQIVDLGVQVNVPFERTWSCIEDSGDPCWACRPCRAREQAFTQAAKADPLRAVRKL